MRTDAQSCKAIRSEQHLIRGFVFEGLHQKRSNACVYMWEWHEQICNHSVIGLLSF
jgi:hypothetical protein